MAPRRGEPWTGPSRLHWRRAVDAAQALALREGVPAATAVAELDFLLKAAKKTTFPVVGYSASQAADGFLKFAGAFVIASIPEWRAAYAQVMGVAAQCLDRLLRSEETAHQQLTNRMMGEKD